MSFDFFNEGIKKDTGPQFSKEENQFLQAKLLFLDPKGTKAIPISNALDFLKFSGLRSDRIQKILKACNVQSGKKTLTYEEMKKVFRGVALAQDNIEPSSININANIKTKMPVFYDEDSEEEAQEQKNPPQQQMPISQPPGKTSQSNQVQRPPVQEVKPEKDKLNVFQGVFPPNNAGGRPSQQLQKSNFAQFPPMQPSNHFSQSQSQKQPQENTQIANKIKQFQVKWKKLKTEGNKIDGGEVKNLCKKLSDRSILSRAWKLCCLTHTGSLTKGQFYVFLEMISTNKIPQQLSSQMKAIIQEIDQTRRVEKQQIATVSTPKTNVLSQQSSSFTQLASSQLFQNFNKIETKPKEEMRLPQENENTQKIINKLTEAKKSVESNNSQMAELKRGQEMMNNLMCEVEQYIVAVDTRSNGWSSQIEELKQSQLLLNDRLNKVCQGMNTVIMKQHTIIDDLVNNFATQNNISNQRVTMLQNYVLEIKQQLEVREQQLAQVLKQKSNQKTEQIEVKVETKAQIQQVVASPQSQKPQEIPEEHVVTVFAEAVAQQLQEFSKVENQQPQQQQPKPEEVQRNSVTREEDPEYEQRMKSKRTQVLQLIMYITPLTQEEMPALIQRISEYSEEELNMVYINCYQKLQARQEMQAQRAAQMRSTEQDFNTSNFKGEAPPTQDMFQ